MKLRENWAVKALAFTAAVAAFAAAAVMGWYQLANYEALWDPDFNEGDGYSIYYLEQRDVQDIVSLLHLYEHREAGYDLSLYEEQEIARLENELSATSTNLRWQLLDQDEQVLYGNTRQAIPARGLGLYVTHYAPMSLRDTSEILTDVVWERIAGGAVNVADPANAVYTDEWALRLGECWQQYREETGGSGGAPVQSALLEEAVSTAQEWSLDGVDLDTVFLSADGTSDLLLVEGEDGLYLYGPCLRWIAGPNQFGFRYDLGQGWIQEDGGARQGLALALWLDGSLPVADQYRQAFQSLNQWRGARGLLLGGTIACGVLGIILAVYLCAACGRRRGREGVSLNWFHRLPLDGLTLALAVGGAVALRLVLEIAMDYAYSNNLSMTGQLVMMGLLAAAGSAMGLGWLLTVVAQCKTHSLLRNTLLWRICRRCWGLGRQVLAAVPLVWKVPLVGLGYVLFTILTFSELSGLWLLGSGVLIAFAGVWAFHWKKIRTGSQEIIRGNPDYHIDTRHMPADLKGHADELNNLGQAISAAVEDRMKSEHFKAELITNVSHDLKTPLTSIINYVDLLKKQGIDDPKAAEYIEVLDRKSQRLKKLTEDLVEASKASTGNLAVSLERLDLGQLLDQAAAEYVDRLEGRGLSVVRTLPEQPVWVMADGRHLWRIIDNLLSNCAKYALEGTRIYLGLQVYSDSAAFSVKNISREALNLPPERLLERFVRGDASRTEEGSGLGLSIAQSLTELQRGRFALSIDGDLFKVTVTLPLAPGGSSTPAP